MTHRGLRRRRASQPGLCLAALLVAAVVGGCGGDGSNDEVQYTSDAALDLIYPQESAADVVSWADQVSIVTAESVREIEDAPLSPGEADDPRPLFRKITFRIESTLWHREGRPMLARGRTFAALTGGMLSPAPERQKLTFEGIAFIETGQQYLMPLGKNAKLWMPELPLATFPLEDSTVRLAPFQTTRLARSLSGVEITKAAKVFDQAQPTKPAARFLNLDPRGRVAAVSRVRRAR
jgi:hypothetical protein